MKTKLIKTASGMEVEKDGKSYPVRSEYEEGFMELALHEFCKQNNKDERFVSEFSIPFVKALSQGIEIDSERVKIEELCQEKDHNGINKIIKEQGSYLNITKPCTCNKFKYATLLTEDKDIKAWEDVHDKFIRMKPYELYKYLEENYNLIKK